MLHLSASSIVTTRDDGICRFMPVAVRLDCVGLQNSFFFYACSRSRNVPVSFVTSVLLSVFPIMCPSVRQLYCLSVGAHVSVEFT